MKNCVIEHDSYLGREPVHVLSTGPVDSLSGPFGETEPGAGNVTVQRNLCIAPSR